MTSGPGVLLADVALTGDVDSVMAAVRDALRDWIGSGPVFLATADPITGSFTATFTFDIPHEAAEAFFRIESSGRDVLSFDALSASSAPWGSLYDATQAQPELSRRWRDVIEPLSWGDELRAVVRDHGAVWGYLCVHRGAKDRRFSARDQARLCDLLPAVATAMRSVAVPRANDGVALDTGVVLVDGRCRVTGTTGGGAAWLEEMAPRTEGGLPLVLASLALTVLERGHPASTTITTRTGRAAFVEAAPLLHDGEQQVVIVMTTPPVGHTLERLALASGMTPREREIVSHVVAGLSTQDIAQQLSISPGTVQAHLTSVFTKTGLRSRRDLVSRLNQ